MDQFMKKKHDTATLNTILNKEFIDSSDIRKIVTFSKKYSYTLKELFWWKMIISDLLWFEFTLVDGNKRSIHNHSPHFFTETKYACYLRKWCNFEKIAQHFDANYEDVQIQKEMKQYIRSVYRHLNIFRH